MNIYTSQMRYGGSDRIDVTAQSGKNEGIWFAPPWFLVRGIKRGELSQEQYTEEYLEELAHVPSEILQLLSNKSEITLVCYCPKNNFCHRIIAAHWLENRGIGEYLGER